SDLKTIRELLRDYADTGIKACLTRRRKRYPSIQTVVAITSKWQRIDGTTGISTKPLKAKKLRAVHPIAATMDAMDTIRAHSCNFNTPIARQPPTPARTNSENPPATPIPTIARESGSPASLPVIPRTATRKKAIEPRAKTVAPKNV